MTDASTTRIRPLGGECLLAVATPRVRTRLLAHVAELEPRLPHHVAR